MYTLRATRLDDAELRNRRNPNQKIPQYDVSALEFLYVRGTVISWTLRHVKAESAKLTFGAFDEGKKGMERGDVEGIVVTEGDAETIQERDGDCLCERLKIGGKGMKGQRSEVGQLNAHVSEYGEEREMYVWCIELIILETNNLEVIRPSTEIHASYTVREGQSA